jgi:glutamine synthetase
MSRYNKISPLEELRDLIDGPNGKKEGQYSPVEEQCKTPEDVITYAKVRNLLIVDYKFTDLFGRWHHFSMPIHQLTVDVFEDGLGFDGSSIRAFQGIHESDMLLFPDPSTATVDPILTVPTLSLTCHINDPVTLEPYSKDTRWVAKKAENFLKESGIGDISFWGAEAEFFIFDGVKFDYKTSGGHFEILSDMAEWEQGREYSKRKGSNLGYRPEKKRGYYRVPPVDSYQDWRSEAVLRMLLTGIDIEIHHGEVASAGQQEINMKYNTLLKSADQMQWYKYILKNVAAAKGKSVTFMPKPMYGDNGSGMHCHQSIWKDGVNQFYDKDGYSSLSQNALWYIGGILKHTPALLAFVAPTTNSYKRLVPGYEAPVIMAYSSRNRSAAVRIPVFAKNPNPSSVRIEYRSPDATGNPYLSFSACLMAGIDGIINQIDPGKAMDIDLYEDDTHNVSQVPGSLNEVLNALEIDNEFLLRGDVFTKDLIDTWIDWKRTNDVDALRLRPHPYEYLMYYDI